MVRRFAVLFSLALLLVASIAEAQTPAMPTPEQMAEARSLFDQGLANSRVERWGEALEFFRRSAAIAERPTTVFNIGTALLRLGRVTEASTTLQHFLDVATDPTLAASRTEATRMLSEAQAARVTLSMHVDPPDANVRLDGVLRTESGADRRLYVDPGRHVLEVLRDGYTPSSEDLSTLPGEALTRSISLVQIAVVTTLTVAPSVATALVELDGREVEADVALTIEPGDHVVRVTTADYQPFERTMTVERGQTMRVEAQLEPIVSQTQLWEDPVFWTVTGIIAAALAAGTAVLVYFTTQGPDVYRGNTGVVVHALDF